MGSLKNLKIFEGELTFPTSPPPQKKKNEDLAYRWNPYAEEKTWMVDPGGFHAKADVICISGCDDHQTSAAWRSVEVRSDSKQSGHGSKLNSRGKPQVLVHVSNCQGFILAPVLSHSQMGVASGCFPTTVLLTPLFFF